VIDIDERVRPKLSLHFLATDHFTRPFKQNGQNGKRLTGQFQLSPRLPELPRAEINFEEAKADAPRRLMGIVHSSRPHPQSGLRAGITTVYPERRATKSPDYNPLTTDFLLTFQRPAMHGADCMG
jgi:hypothetical protein